MGRPVVAEAGGGAAEAIRPGITGWIAEADNAASLADALASALALDAHGRAELARSAQEQTRSHYNITQSSERLLALYRRLAG
jgi:glycosyltransferase involved in cell wall biosynthesis